MITLDLQFNGYCVIILDLSGEIFALEWRIAV